MACLKYVARNTSLSTALYMLKNFMSLLRYVAEMYLKSYLSTFLYMHVESLWHSVYCSYTSGERCLKSTHFKNQCVKAL